MAAGDDSAASSDTYGILSSIAGHYSSCSAKNIAEATLDKPCRSHGPRVIPPAGCENPSLVG
jgi:hypothetical protein